MMKNAPIVILDEATSYTEMCIRDRDAPIVILDEATSSVDPANQRALLTAINELTKGKTLIIIAHRLSTIKNADQIVVLDDGSISQQGKHTTLIQQDGIYRRFVQIRQRCV